MTTQQPYSYRPTADGYAITGPEGYVDTEWDAASAQLRCDRLNTRAAEEAAALALEARAALADEQAEAEAWAQAAETCESCGASGETIEQPDGRLLCAWCAGFRAPGRFGRFERDVYDFAANRWYCTAVSWPYSPAARAGAEAYEVAA